MAEKSAKSHTKKSGHPCLSLLKVMGERSVLTYSESDGCPDFLGSDQFKSQIEDALERRLGSGRRGRPKLETKKGL